MRSFEDGTIAFTGTRRLLRVPRRACVGKKNQNPQDRGRSVRRSRISSRSTYASPSRRACASKLSASSLTRLVLRLGLDSAMWAVEVLAGHHLVHEIYPSNWRRPQANSGRAGLGLDAILLDVAACECRATEHHRAPSSPRRDISSRFSRINPTTVDFTTEISPAIADHFCLSLLSAASRIVAIGLLDP